MHFFPSVCLFVVKCMRMKESLYIQYACVSMYKLSVCVRVRYTNCVRVLSHCVRSGAPGCPLLRFAPALPPRCAPSPSSSSSSSSASTSSSSSTVPELLSPLFLLEQRRGVTRAAVVVAWGAVSQGLAVLAQVGRVNQRHHVLVPGLGSRALIG